MRRIRGFSRGTAVPLVSFTLALLGFAASGVLPVAVVALSSGVGHAQTTATYGPVAGGSIPDDNAAGISRTITVGATPDLVTSLNSVTITGLIHPWMGDLTATLSHAGVSVSLFARPGGAGDNSNFSGTYTFIPTAAQTVAQATASLGDVNLPAGNYRPAGNFSSFAGLALTGDWTLNINDQAGEDLGSYTSWQFNATSAAPAPPPPGTYTNNTGGNIPDGPSSGVTSDITVTDVFQINTFDSVTIRGLQHTLVGDLTARIQNVNTGTTIDLFNRPGRTTTGEFDYGDDSNLSGNYTFQLNGADFTAAAGQGNTSYSVPGGTYAASTSAVPSEANPLTLAAFNGTNVNGVWRLILTDSVAGDVGSFGGWGFSVTPFAVVPEPGAGALFGFAGLFGLAGLRRRAARRAAFRRDTGEKKVKVSR